MKALFPKRVFRSMPERLCRYAVPHYRVLQLDHLASKNVTAFASLFSRVCSRYEPVTVSSGQDGTSKQANGG